MLAGAADAFALLLVEVLALCRRPVPGELRQVGEDGEDLELAVQQLGVVGRELVACLLVLADEPAGLLHAHVEAHDQAAQGVQVLARAQAVAGVRRSGQRAEADPRGIGRRRVLDDRRLDAQERRPRVDVGVAGHEHLPDPPGMRGHDRHLHLHRLEDRDRRPGLHLVARGHGHGHDERRRGGPHDPALVARHAMGDPVDLDEVVGTVGDRVDRERPSADREPAREAAEGLDPHVDGRAVGLDPVPAGARSARRRGGRSARGGGGRPSGRPRGSPGAGRERRRHRSRGARAPPRSRRRRSRRRAARRRRGASEMWPSAATRRSSQPVSAVPAITSGRSSRSSRNALFVVPPRTTTVVSARARRNRALASARSRPQPMTLAIIESYSAAMTSPSATPVSTRIPGPDGSISSSTVPGAGAKPRSGSSALSRASIAWPDAGGGSRSRRPPAATWSCSLTRSRPVVASVTGCSTCRRGVDLEEREGRSSGLVEELDGAGVAIAGGTGQVDSRGPELALLLGAEGRGARLLDQLLVAALDRAVAHARCPDGAVVVGDDLNLDVARAGDQALDEDRRVAEASAAPRPARARRPRPAPPRRQPRGCRARPRRPGP